MVQNTRCDSRGAGSSPAIPTKVRLKLHKKLSKLDRAITLINKELYMYSFYYSGSKYYAHKIEKAKIKLKKYDEDRKNTRNKLKGY